MNEKGKAGSKLDQTQFGTKSGAYQSLTPHRRLMYFIKRTGHGSLALDCTCMACIYHTFWCGFKYSYLPLTGKVIYNSWLLLDGSLIFKERTGGYIPGTYGHLTSDNKKNQKTHIDTYLPFKNQRTGQRIYLKFHKFLFFQKPQNWKWFYFVKDWVDFVSIVGGCYTKEFPPQRAGVLKNLVPAHFTKQPLSFFPMIPRNIHRVSQEMSLK